MSSLVLFICASAFPCLENKMFPPMLSYNPKLTFIVVTVSLTSIISIVPFVELTTNAFLNERFS